MQVLVWVLLGVVIILAVMVLFLMNQVKNLFYIMFQTSGLAVGQNAPELKELNGTGFEDNEKVGVVFAGTDCSRCIEMIEELHKKAVHANVFVLATNKEADLDKFRSDDSKNSVINVIMMDHTVKKAYQVIFEPFYFVIQKGIVKEKGILESPELIGDVLNRLEQKNVNDLKEVK